LFEVKWDGVRALAADAARGWALWGRGGAAYRDRYPELAFLGRLPAGTVLDGELVRGGPTGVPTLAAILRRHQLVQPARVARASRHDPVAYVVFDLLALRGRSLLAEPLHTRRAALHALVRDLNEPSLLFSAAVGGGGTVLWEGGVAGGHEGMRAKPRAGRYRRGRRWAAWRKIKPPRRPPPPAVTGG